MWLWIIIGLIMALVYYRGRDASQSVGAGVMVFAAWGIMVALAVIGVLAFAWASFPGLNMGTLAPFFGLGILGFFLVLFYVGWRLYSKPDIL